MEITLKIVLSADASFLSVLQSLIGQKSVTQTIIHQAGTDGASTTNGEIEKPVITEKKTRKTKESLLVELAKAEIPNATDKEIESITETEHTLDSLRAIAVPLSKAGHKDAIKAWLTKSGYENGLAALEAKDFQNFFNYLQTLN